MFSDPYLDFSHFLREGEHRVEIHDFSNEDVHTSSRLSMTYLRFEINSFEKDKMSFKIYANGNSNENKGFVSLFIEISDGTVLFNLGYPELSFVMSVVDVSGNQRFSQSLKISSLRLFEEGVKKTSFGLDKFLKRETLLIDQSDLLPNDTLTVCLYCNYPPYDRANKIFNGGFLLLENHPNKIKLSLDSPIIKILSEESEFFQRLLETPMKEKRDGFMEISNEEYFYWGNIATMLREKCYISLDISQVCGLYQTAHTYRIPAALDKCRKFMERILTHENVPEISDIAQTYDDSYLKEAVENFLKKASESFNLLSDEKRKKWPFERTYILDSDKRYPDVEGLFSELAKEYPDFDFYK